jgi:hypothetical protein
MTALVTTREIGVNRTAQGFSSRHRGRASGHTPYEEGPCVIHDGAGPVNGVRERGLLGALEV